MSAQESGKMPKKFRPNWASDTSSPGDQTSAVITTPGSAPPPPPPGPSNLRASSTLPVRDSPYSIPILGFGIYKSPASVCARSCAQALSVGYRHIDSAQYYENEAEMGEAVVKSGIAREEVFLTTKILSTGGSPEKTYRKCLDSVEKIDAGVEGKGGRKGYVDLFLIHAAVGGPETRKEMWLALERLFEEGRARAIGVSNFGIKHVAEMKGWGKVWPPHVNQLELHPWCQQVQITNYCKENSIVVEAYCPLVRNMRAHNTTLLSISRAYGKTPAQILVRWSLQKGWVPLPKSDTASRIEENAGVFGWEIRWEDMQRLDGLDEGDAGAIVHAVRNHF